MGCIKNFISNSYRINSEIIHGLRKLSPTEDNDEVYLLQLNVTKVKLLICFVTKNTKKYALLIWFDIKYMKYNNCSFIWCI